MKYKGYTGVVELDEASRTLFGRVIGLRDTITFQGESVAEVVQAFHDSVDDYLEFCSQRGERPEKPYSGQFLLRIDPQLHRELASTAEAQDMSLNALVEGALKKVFPVHGSATKDSTGPVLKSKPSGKKRLKST
jgi:predicted HicB family RNase H-like nuclease